MPHYFTEAVDDLEKMREAVDTYVMGEEEIPDDIYAILQRVKD